MYISCLKPKQSECCIITNVNVISDVYVAYVYLHTYWTADIISLHNVSLLNSQIPPGHSILITECSNHHKPVVDSACAVYYLNVAWFVESPG